MGCMCLIDWYYQKVTCLVLAILQDDDSDLEFELEPFPAVSSEASSEAAACVKVTPFLFCLTFNRDFGLLWHYVILIFIYESFPN